MKRMILASVATIGFGLAVAQPALAGASSLSDLPQTMGCGDSFPISAESYASFAGAKGCAEAIAQVNTKIDQFTSLLEGRCNGTLQIGADRYVPAQGECGGNATLGFDYSRQRTVTCECAGTISGR